MQTDPWLPLYLSLVFILGGAVIAFLFVPETNNWARMPDLALLPAPGTALTLNAVENSTNKAAAQTNTTLPEDSASVSPHVKPSVRGALGALRHRNVLLLIPGTVLSVPLVSSQIDLLFRLMPVMYDWTLSASALLVSLRSGINIIVIAALLPTLKWILQKRRRTARRTTQSDDMFVATEALASRLQDKSLASGSAVLVFLGFLLVMMVWSVQPVLIGVVLSSLGAGVPMLCRSLIVAEVHTRRLESSIGSLFGLLAIMETAAYIVFLLGVGALFSVGIGADSWKGWPFFAATIIAATVVACLAFARVDKSVVAVNNDGHAQASVDAIAPTTIGHGRAV